MTKLDRRQWSYPLMSEPLDHSPGKESNSWKHTMKMNVNVKYLAAKGRKLTCLEQSVVKQ
ncbi:unnamed protein product [Leptidea sinapis]|uniref:Uncharacterized protein n=1 Tax=Leptidea sinapis TaxID=189913 RepID=A0A5E4Q7L4_9NEOP|nr:unnamed protein product [Leptidea sinapis]